METHHAKGQSVLRKGFLYACLHANDVEGAGRVLLARKERLVHQRCQLVAMAKRELLREHDKNELSVGFHREHRHFRYNVIEDLGKEAAVQIASVIPAIVPQESDEPGAGAESVLAGLVVMQELPEIGGRCDAW